MSTPAGSADPFAALADELGRLGRRLDAIGAELLALRATAGPRPAPGSGPWSGSSSWSEDVRAGGPVASHQYPDGPYPQAQPAGYHHRADGRHPWPPSPGAAFPPVAATSRPSSTLSGARLLAWTGAAVTLLGVVLFLVLAASRGWFSPPARIGTGVVLGAGLVGLGLWLHRRQSARTGALALAATGFATFYLVVAAAAAGFGYLDPVPAVVLAGLVAGSGLGVADRWRSELLACGVTVGGVVLAPVLAGGWLLVALALALQLAALPVVLRGRWSVLMLLAAAGPVLYGLVVVAVGALGGPADLATAAAVAPAVLAVAIGTAVPAARLLPVVPVGVLVAAAPLPVLAAATVVGGWGGAGLASVVVVTMAGLAALPGSGRAVRLVAATAAAVALFEAAAVALDGSTWTLVLLGGAVVAVVLAGALRSRFTLVVGLVYGAVGVLVALIRDVPLGALVGFPALPFVGVDGADVRALIAGGAASALVLALAGALLGAGGRVGWIRPDAPTAGLWVPIGLAGLYGAAGLVLTLALLVAADRPGFTAGHAVVTVSWTVGALVLLARGISRPALRIAGLVLAAAAVAKLVLFDLVALDGLARVAAFLGAGLVILAAGTRYARLVAEAEAEAVPVGVAEEGSAPPGA